MKNYLKVFAVAFVLAVALAVFSNSFILFSRVLLFNSPSSTFLLMSLIMSSGGFVVSPILVFVAFYFVGKKVNFTAEFRSVIAALAGGSVAGYAVTYFALLFWYAVSGGPSPSYGSPAVSVSLLFAVLAMLASAFGAAVIRVFSTLFFVALAALVLAHFIKTKHHTEPPASQLPQTNPPEPSS